MAKSILTLNQINLLKRSEEPKNKELYGNLFDVIVRMNPNKAISLEELVDLDPKGVLALTHNKSNFIDNVIAEWRAEGNNFEDNTRKTRCGLCNTPNKYIYYIRNRITGLQINVGSKCIMDFPGLDGYMEQKKQFAQLQRDQKKIKRRSEFLATFTRAPEMIGDAEKYFKSLPILLSYGLYTRLNSTIDRMRKIYTTYIDTGKPPFTTQMTPFDLFQLAVDQYAKLKVKSDSFIVENIHSPISCRRREIDWMINNKKNYLIEKIAMNKGEYTRDTVSQMYSYEFVNERVSLFKERLQSQDLVLSSVNEDNNLIIIKVNKVGYSPSISLYASSKDFMAKIGGNCLFDEDYVYKGKDVLAFSKIMDVSSNLDSIVAYVINIMNSLGCAFVIDHQTDSLYLYRKADRAIAQINRYAFMQNYCKHILGKDSIIKNFLRGIINCAQWISGDQQFKLSLSDKIAKLYNEQYL